MSEIRKFAFTFFWQEIFPDYATFKEFTDDLELYADTDTVSENFNQYIYGVLSRHFYDNNIRYDTIDAFKMEFASAYINNFKMLQKRKDLLEKQYLLTTDELEVITKSIVNSAFNPNDELEHPLEPIPFVSAQNYSVGLINKLNSYINAINTMQDMDMDFIIKKFDYLFVQVLPETRMFYLYEQD